MQSISTEVYTHIGIKKDKSQVYMTKKGAEGWEEARKDGYGGFLVLRDIKGFVTFKGTADIIEEVQEIDIRKQNEIATQKEETEIYYREAFSNKSKKQKWTQDKLQELKDDEIQYFVDMAKDRLKNMIKNEDIMKKVGDKFVSEYGMCLLRKYYNCPFA